MNNQPRMGLSKKLLQKYDGPYKIVQKRSPLVYTLDINGIFRTVTINRLRKAHLNSKNPLNAEI